MPEVPYSRGVPSVSPDSTPPGAYFRSEVSPNAFGAGIGNALHGLGAQLSATAERFDNVFGQVQADDAKNGAQDQLGKLLHGDPNTTVTNPDGSQGPQLGFLASRGRNTLDQWKGVSTEVDSIIKRGRSGLTSVDAQRDYDRWASAYKTHVMNSIGAHAGAQANVYAAEVNKSAGNLALTHIANNAESDEQFAHGLADLRSAYIKNAQIAGDGDAGLAAAASEASEKAWETRLEAISVKDPIRAYDLAEKNKAELGPRYHVIEAQFRARKEAQVATDFVKQRYADEQARASSIAANPDGLARVADDALTKVGRNEIVDNKDIRDYLRTGGHDMDPAKAAWCAAFVGAALNHAGIPGLSSNVATDYLNWGAPVSGGVHKGDIVVEARGLTAGQTGGHVSIATGKTDARGNIEVISGNTSNGVGTEFVSPAEVVMRRWDGGNAAVAENRSGPSDDYAEKVSRIESSGGAASSNIFQFTGPTAAKYGVNSTTTPAEQRVALQRLTADNQQLLQAADIPINDVTLYIAHQRGAQGAINLLKAPDDAIAANIVGGPSVDSKNPFFYRKDGTPLTVSESKAVFANKMGVSATATERAGVGAIGASGARAFAPTQQGFVAQPTEPAPVPAPDFSIEAPEPAAPLPMLEPPSLDAIKANVMRSIMESRELTDGEKTRALADAEQVYAVEHLRESSQKKAQRDAADAAANEYVQKTILGETDGLVEEIARDPRLTWEARRSLAAAVQKESDKDARQAAKDYGPGFWDVYKSITAPTGEERLSDVSELLRRAGPGGDLTLSGVQKLMQIMAQSKKSVDDASVHSAKTGLLNYAKGQLSFEQNLGLVKIPDPKGEAIFNGQFIPKFEAAFDVWVKSGKNPWDFLTQENVDKMLSGLRPKAQRDMDRLSALGEATAGSAQQKQLPLPPDEVRNQGTWLRIVAQPPTLASGKPVPLPIWAGVLETLVRNQSPEAVAGFNASSFGHVAGYDGAKLIEQLTGRKP